MEYIDRFVDDLDGFMMILTVLFGVPFLIWSIYTRKFGRRKWRPTDGYVMTSEVVKSEGQYMPLVHYVYNVEGYVYQGFGPDFVLDERCFSSTTPGPIEDFVKRYPRGESVTVRYNPTRPKESVMVFSEAIG